MELLRGTMIAVLGLGRVSKTPPPAPPPSLYEHLYELAAASPHLAVLSVLAALLVAYLLSAALTSKQPARPRTPPTPLKAERALRNQLGESCALYTFTDAGYAMALEGRAWKAGGALKPRKNTKTPRPWNTSLFATETWNLTPTHSALPTPRTYSSVHC